MTLGNDHVSDTLENLLDAAERNMRLRGYHAVSFRDLADELGVKSSSVHYYFRQKEDLGLALVARYSERFFAAVDERAEPSRTSQQKLKAFYAVYREALVSSDRICLCGMLGAESCGLPPALAKAVAAFFAANVDWVADALGADHKPRDCRVRAHHIVAALQGAMILSTSLDDHSVFDDTVRSLVGS